MSSIPGYTLEAFIAWNYNLTVENLAEANVSLGIAQMLGNIPVRKHLTDLQFKELITKFFESYREEVEDKLLDYDEEDHGSWRDASEMVSCKIPDTVFDEAKDWITSKTELPILVDQLLSDI